MQTRKVNNWLMFLPLIARRRDSVPVLLVAPLRFCLEARRGISYWFEEKNIEKNKMGIESPMRSNTSLYRPFLQTDENIIYTRLL